MLSFTQFLCKNSTMHRAWSLPSYELILWSPEPMCSVYQQKVQRPASSGHGNCGPARSVNPLHPISFTHPPHHITQAREPGTQSTVRHCLLCTDPEFHTRNMKRKNDRKNTQETRLILNNSVWLVLLWCSQQIPRHATSDRLLGPLTRSGE